MPRSRKLAKIVKIKGISSIWIIPILTIIIGSWIAVSHFLNQGIEITLLTKDANGIVAGKTSIKSRSVDVGIVKEVTLDDDYKQVVVKATLYHNMKALLKNDTVFWVVKPEIGRDGITGLNTLLSGNYIELIVGNDESSFKNQPFNLSSNPTRFDSSVKGIRINLESEQNGVIPEGAAILFKGYRVGHVLTSKFDVASKKMNYQVFIVKPYDSLVTKNVRFWKEGGFNINFSSQGVDFDMPSLDVLLSGGISFGLPDGSPPGDPVEQLGTYTLYENKRAILNSGYMDYEEFLLMFDDTISGLSEGAPVQYRGMRLGTVSKVPFYTDQMLEASSILDQNIPILIRIEPERLSKYVNKKIDIGKLLISEQQNGLRASLKTRNFLTGDVYVDLDFYAKKNDEPQQTQRYGYNIIQTESSGIAKIQQKIMDFLDKMDQLPINKTVNQFNSSLAEIQKLTESLNQILSNKEMQNLPQDIKQTLNNVNSILKDLQSNSSLSYQVKDSVQKIDSMLDQLTPLLNTLNRKSNALLFSSPPIVDPEPKAKGSH